MEKDRLTEKEQKEFYRRINETEVERYKRLYQMQKRIQEIMKQIERSYHIPDHDPDAFRRTKRQLKALLWSILTKEKEGRHKIGRAFTISILVCSGLCPAEKTFIDDFKLLSSEYVTVGFGQHNDRNAIRRTWVEDEGPIIDYFTDKRDLDFQGLQDRLLPLIRGRKALIGITFKGQSWCASQTLIQKMADCCGPKSLLIALARRGLENQLRKTFGDRFLGFASAVGAQDASYYAISLGPIEQQTESMLKILPGLPTWYKKRHPCPNCGNDARNYIVVRKRKKPTYHCCKCKHDYEE